MTAATTFRIGYRNGPGTASETDQEWFGLSQICLKSHADRSGGDAPFAKLMD